MGKEDIFLLEDMLTHSGHGDHSYIQDMVAGFPVTDAIPSGGCGTPIPGGQRVRGKPGLGGPEPIAQLKKHCGDKNHATIKAAEARAPHTEEDQLLAVETWKTFQQDVERGYAGAPQELDAVNLEEILLVDSFGVWERHSNSDWKVRVLNNFRANSVNDFAWLPAKMKYDVFSELMQAARVLKQRTRGDLLLGKSDFKSAYKTLTASTEQAWLC